jgi:hypothetical protein
VDRVSHLSSKIGRSPKKYGILGEIEVHAQNFATFDPQPRIPSTPLDIHKDQDPRYPKTSGRRIKRVGAKKFEFSQL